MSALDTNILVYAHRREAEVGDQCPEPHLYPATPTPEPEGGSTVVFRDLPEAITCGDNPEDVMAMARDVLQLAVAERIARGEEVPVASAAEPGDILVRLRPSLAAKAALHNAQRNPPPSSPGSGSMRMA